MRYVVPAFLSEGPTDRPFLEPILTRVLQEMLGGVEVQSFLILSPNDRSIEQIKIEVCERRQEFDLLLVHTDGKGDGERARRERIEPIRAVLQDAAHARCVGIVPVHETEAWALADGDALRYAFEVTHSNDEMGLPRLHELETLQDPKSVLRGIQKRVRGRSRRVAKVPLSQIAEAVSLVHLRKLAAFMVFEEELENALRCLSLGV